MDNEFLVKLQRVVSTIDKKVWCDPRIKASTREASGLSAEEIRYISLSLILIADVKHPEKVH